MSIAAELRDWIALLNLLIVPLFVFVLQTKTGIAKLVAEMEAHSQLDQERFSGIHRDVERVEGVADAAHKRLDRFSVPAAGGLQ